MSINRAQVDGGANNVRAQQSGESVLEQIRKTAITTVGAGTITAAALTNGIVERSGPVGAFTDTWAAAADILATSPTLSVGDSFTVVYRNLVAFAMTSAAGLGIVLGTQPDTPASNARKYLFTVLSTGAQQIFAASTTNANATITGLTPTQAATLMPGMGVTGTGIPASTTLLGVNSTLGTVTLSANATATGALVALTFFPRIQVEGIYTAAI